MEMRRRVVYRGSAALKNWRCQMKNKLAIALVAGTLVGGTLISGNAAANGVNLSLSVGVPAYPYAAPPPVYYAPPAYYYPPQPVYYAPRAYYAPPAYYVGPSVRIYGGRVWHGHGHRRW
jgi:hypothetical protein